MGNMTIPLQFVSLYDRQEIFMWSNCLLDLGTDFLVGKMVFVSDVYKRQLQARLFLDVVFPPLALSALYSPLFYCALQDGFSQT